MNDSGWSGVLGGDTQPIEVVVGSAEWPQSQTQNGTQMHVAPMVKTNDGVFRPIVYEPPSWVHERLGRMDGMIYVYCNRQSAITALSGWILLAIVGLMFSTFVAVVVPANMVFIAGILLLILLAMPFYKWYLWKRTLYLVTLNTKSNKKHIRRVRNIPTLMRPIFGSSNSKDVPFERIAAGGFESKTIDGLLGTTSLKGDTAAQVGDLWLLELKHLKLGKYLEQLNVWMGQN